MKRRPVKIDVSGKMGKGGHSREDEIDCESKDDESSEDHPAAPEDPSAVVADSRAEPIDEAVGHY